MDSNPTISVIICGYTENRWTDIQEAVASLSTQVKPAQQIVLVIDHNPQLYQKAITQFPSLTVIENSQAKGLSGGRNSGVAASTGEIVAFLDDDAVAAPGWLHSTLVHFTDDQVAGVGALAEPLWTGGHPRWFPEEFLWVVGCSYKGLQAGPVRNMIGCAMAFRRSVFEAAGGFDSRFGRTGSILPISCEETEFCMRVGRTLAGAKFVYEPEGRISHKVPASRLTLRYFLLRCVAEGISKARLMRLKGPSTSLAVEQSYVIRTLTAGVIRGGRDFIWRFDPWGLARSAAIGAGLGATVAGYVVGRLTSSRSSERADALTVAPPAAPGA